MSTPYTNRLNNSPISTPIYVKPNKEQFTMLFFSPKQNNQLPDLLIPLSLEPEPEEIPIVYCPPTKTYPEYLNRSLPALSAQSRKINKQTPSSEPSSVPLEQQTPLYLRLTKKSDYKLLPYKDPNYYQKKIVNSLDYCKYLSSVFPDHDLTFNALRLNDLELAIRKTTHFSVYDTDEYLMTSYTFQHLPFFLNKIVIENASSFQPKSLLQLTSGDNLMHYLSTHHGRRNFSRSPAYYHLHITFSDILFPNFVDSRPGNVTDDHFNCKYLCGHFGQTCAWHSNFSVPPFVAVQRQLLYNLLSRLELFEDPCFWLSFGFILFDQSYSLDSFSDEKPYPYFGSCRPHSLVNIPDIRNLHQDSIQWWRPDDFLCSSCTERFDDANRWYAHYRQMHMQRAQGMKTPAPQTSRSIMCKHCNICFENNAALASHQLSICNPPPKYSRDTPIFSTSLSKYRCPSCEIDASPCPIAPIEMRSVTESSRLSTITEVTEPEASQSDIDECSPFSFSREYITSKISDLLHAVGDTADALPCWIQSHTRFIINVVCNCVSIMFSKTWISVAASLSSLVNEICHEFPQLIRQKVDAMVNCLKQVIWRFFPHSQAAPSVEQDNKAANESFITSVFGIITAIIPGVTVEAGLLKARVERIKCLTTVLQSAKTIGEWFMALFDRFWTWIQIYFYGATSEQLARQKALLSSPEIQLWINDVSKFELGADLPDGTHQPSQVTQLLVSESAQDEVLDLKKRGEEHLKILNLGDALKNSGVSRLVSAHLKKVNDWFKIFKSSRGAHAPKHEPFILYLYGDPGIGKTYCVDYICQALAKSTGKTFNPATDLFTKPRTTEYFDGYSNQFCFLLDDFLQVTNEQANSSEISFIIDAGSRSKYHLDMAQCEAKSDAYFNSPLVMITSNKKMVPESFETKIESFSALARRIDLMIEVRRQAGTKPDASKVFDTSGLFFHASKFQLDPEADDGGSWEPVGPPFNWDGMIDVLTLLFAKKEREQTLMDNMKDISEDTVDRMTSLVEQYSTFSGDTFSIVSNYVANECQETRVDWKDYSLDSRTGAPSYALKTVFAPRDSETSQMSSSESLSSKVGFESCIRRAKYERKMKKRRPSWWRRNSKSSLSSPEIQSEVDEGEPDEDILSSAPDLEPPIEEACEEQIVPMQHAQGEGPSKYHCLIVNCGATFPFYNSRDHVFMHMLEEASAFDLMGDAHAQVSANVMEEFLSRFARNIHLDYLGREDMSWYQYVQNRFIDYHPRGSPWTLSQLVAGGHMDLAHAVLEFYRRREHVGLLSRIVSWPWQKTQQFAATIHRAVSSAVNAAVAPVAPIVTAINQASTLIDRATSSIKKVALVGLVLTCASSAIAICYLRWFKDVSKETVQKEVMRAERTEHNVEAGFRSDDFQTYTKPRRRLHRIECRYAANADIQCFDPAITMVRVRPNEDKELTISLKGNKAELHWTTGKVDTVSAESRNGRDIKIGECIAARMVLEDVPEVIESKQDRMQLVEENIGKIPLKQAEAARDPSALDVMKNLGPTIFKVSNLNLGITLHGYFVSGHIAALPRHILGTREARGTHLRFSISVGCFDIVLGDGYPFVEVPTKDTIFVDLKKTNIPARRSILKQFIRSSDIIKPCPGYLCSLNSFGTERSLFVKSLMNIAPLERTEYVDNSGEDTIRIIGGISYTGDSECGDCGSLIVRVDSHSSRKILGFHVAGSTGVGTGVLWTQEALEEQVRKFQVAQAVMDLEFLPIEEDEFFDCVETFEEKSSVKVTYSELLGMIPQELAPGAPLTNKIVPSPLFGKISETKSGPSTLRPFVNSAGEKKFPLKLALEKLESPMIQFDPKLVKKVAARMSGEYAMRGLLDYYGDSKNGKLTLEENLQGSPDDKWIKSLNMKTSPGYPYVLKGNKSEFVDPEKLWISPILERAMNEREVAARESREFPALMTDVLKDERLSNEKREKGKVRIFNVCPLDYNMLVRKYFTRFLAQMMNSHICGEVSVGINPHSDDWEAFYTLLKKSGSHWIAGDYSAWDKRAPYDIAMALLPMVESFYAKFSDYDPADANVRRVLISQAFQSVRLAQTKNKGLIYRVHQSMPSGIAVTAVYNSLINSLLFRVIFAELAIQHGESEGFAINEYSKHVTFAAYGDDHIARVSDVVYPFFNMLTISKQMAKHNITYTSTMKGDVEEPEVQDEDLTYLKRKFVYHGSRLDAPMDLDAILDILNWVNAADPLDVREACGAAVKSVLIELSHHDEATYHKWWKEIYRACHESKVDCPVVTYAHTVNKRRTMDFDYGDDFY